MEKAEHIADMRFCLDDYSENRFNESVDCTFQLWGGDNDETMSIETYWHLCTQFAAALGFAPKTIETWFGDY